MTSSEMVTTWSPGEAEKEGKPIVELIKALNVHLKEKGIEPEEYGFNVQYDIGWNAPDTPMPAFFWQLVAFAVEGGSEGYYVHVGCILKAKRGAKYPEYMEFGLAKTYTPDSAYALAKEAQRWLTAIRWN